MAGLEAEAESGAGVGTADACVQCGRGPAAEVDLRAHTGMVVLARYSRLSGRLCRQCGLAIFRNRMNHTLLLGWWGVLAFFLNFYAIFKNLTTWRRLHQLDEPQGALPTDEESQPLDPGRPVWLRPGFAAVIALFIVGNLLIDAGDPEPTLVGQCVDLGTQGLKIVDCEGMHDGMVLNMTDSSLSCAEGSDEAIRLRRQFQPIACVDLDR